MKYALIGALAVSVMASPAAAEADRGGYVGVEGGLLLVNDIKGDSDGFTLPDIELSAITTQVATPSGTGINADLDTGFDVDLVAGYDWGWVRTEIEGAYKRASFDEVAVSPDMIFGGTHDADGSLSAWSLAVNVLLDIPLGGGFNFYAGPGIGHVWLRAHPKVDLNGGSSSKLDDERESGLFLQGIAGVRKSISDKLDLGLKYRYIRSKRESFDSGVYGDVRARFTSHSILASLIYNFRSAPPAPIVEPAPPPPPPPPPPATQTCPDGSVILATEACPPPPPPPPPAPEPERG